METTMECFQQILSAIYVALGEAAGGRQALRTANKALRAAIADGTVDDPMAITMLECISCDEDDEDAPTDCERVIAEHLIGMNRQLGTTA